MTGPNHFGFGKKKQHSYGTADVRTKCTYCIKSLKVTNNSAKRDKSE